MYTTPYNYGILTIKYGARLYLTGESTGNEGVAIYLKSPELNVVAGGTLFFDGNKANLALPANSILEVCSGGLTGTSTNGNANQNIYIGNQWYAVGNSNKTQFSWDELMTGCKGTLEAEIGYSSPICIGNAIALTGSFTGTSGTPPTYS